MKNGFTFAELRHELINFLPFKFITKTIDKMGGDIIRSYSKSSWLLREENFSNWKNSNKRDPSIFPWNSSRSYDTCMEVVSELF